MSWSLLLAASACAAGLLPSLCAQTTVRISVSSTGGDPDGASATVAISDDGAYVAFVSEATNLVVFDTNGVADVYLLERASGTLTRVSVGTGGAQADAASSAPSVSGDGLYTAFASSATNLVVNDTNGVEDVFVHNRVTGVTTRVSVSSSGVQGNLASNAPSISGKSSYYVAFQSAASNLVAGDTNGCIDVFRRDLQANVTRRYSVDTAGFDANNHSRNPVISGNGRFIAFESNATNLITPGFDNNLTQDVYVASAALTPPFAISAQRANLRPSGAESFWPAHAPAISYDGRYVAFHSWASNLVANDTNLATDVFVRDMQTATTAMASVDSSGAQGPEASRYARLSSDGRYVVFDTASPLVANDTNEATDVFLHDFQSATTTRVSVESHGNQSASASSRPAIGDEISAAGTYTALAVVFQSAAADLTSGDGNGLDDVFLHDPAGVAPTSVVHCTTSTSTNACNASIAATGTPSLAAASGFTLTCTGIEGQKMCLYFYGTSGPTSLRWATGSTSFLCVQPPTQRTPPQSSAGTATTCNGALALDVLAFLSATPSALGHPLFVGERFDAQLWFRDPPAPKTTNLSNAITFWLTP